MRQPVRRASFLGLLVLRQACRFRERRRGINWALRYDWRTPAHQAIQSHGTMFRSVAPRRVVTCSAGPWSLGKLDSEIIEQRAFLVVHVFDGERVLGDSAKILAFGIGQSPLRVEQQIQ